MPLFIPILIAALLLAGASAATAILMWGKIINWAFDTFFPWIEEKMPHLEPLVRRTFVVLDHVAVEVRNEIKREWQRLRHELLQQLVEFERQSNNEWVVRTISWVRPWLGQEAADQTQAVKVIQEKRVAYSELPAEIREQWLRHGTTPVVDVTNLRDQELGLSESA